MKNMSKTWLLFIAALTAAGCVTADSSAPLLTTTDTLFTQAASRTVAVFKAEKKASVVAVYFGAGEQSQPLADYMNTVTGLEIYNRIRFEKLAINIINRRYLDACVRELDFQAVDFSDRARQLELARRLGADVMLFGWITQSSGVYSLRCRLIRASSGAIAGEFSLRFDPDAETRRNLGLDKALVPAIARVEESTYLPFRITPAAIDEIRRLYGAGGYTFRKYTRDLRSIIKIPDQVTYSAVVAETNERIADDFAAFLRDSAKNTAVVNRDLLVCGPHLTALLKKSGVAASLDFTEVMGPLDVAGRHEVIIEYVFKGDTVPKVLGLVRNLLLSDESFTARKFGPAELGWYWSIVAYDIREPLIMFENRSHKVGVHFTGEGKIFFIDLFENLEW